MIEFIEDGHIYLMDGVIIPSVSEILHFIFPNKYAGIDKRILIALDILCKYKLKLKKYYSGYDPIIITFKQKITQCTI